VVASDRKADPAQGLKYGRITEGLWRRLFRGLCLCPLRVATQLGAALLGLPPNNTLHLSRSMCRCRARCSTGGTGNGHVEDGWGIVTLFPWGCLRLGLESDWGMRRAGCASEPRVRRAAGERGFVRLGGPACGSRHRQSVALCSHLRDGRGYDGYSILDVLASSRALGLAAALRCCISVCIRLVIRRLIAAGRGAGAAGCATPGLGGCSPASIFLYLLYLLFARDRRWQMFCCGVAIQFI
jgi:hypothetical protein